MHSDNRNPLGPAIKAAEPPPVVMPDYVLIAVAFILTAIGVVMVFSASGISSYAKLNDGFYYLKKEVIWVFAAWGGMLFTAFFDYRYYKRMSPWLYLFALVLLVLVLVPGIGKQVNGARRWIDLGFMPFQVSEMGKLFLIIFVSALLAQADTKIREPRVFLIVMGVVGVMACLVLLEPDFGMASIMTVICLSIMFIAGARKIHIAGVMTLALPLAVLLVVFKPYRMRRLMAFWNPWADAQDSGFHIIQSLIAIVSGGVFGRGLGMGNAKRFFLPEQHTDFIFSVILEETGMIGMVLIIVLFAILGWRGFRVAMASQDKFATYMAFGITFTIMLQAVVNMGVAVGVLPVTGLTLPFVSFGGASLISTYLGIGILVNISTRDAVRRKMAYEKNHFGRGGDRGPRVPGNRPRAIN
jgi:cell division protein FtsW